MNTYDVTVTVKVNASNPEHAEDIIFCVLDEAQTFEPDIIEFEMQQIAEEK